MAIKVERTYHHANTHAPLYSGAVGLPNFLSSIRYFLNRCPSTWEVALANTDPPSRPRSHVHCHCCTAHRKTWLGSFSPELSWVPGRRCNCLLDVSLAIIHQNSQNQLFPPKPASPLDISAPVQGHAIHLGPKFKHPESSLPPLSLFPRYRDALCRAFLSFTHASPWSKPFSRL